MPERRGGEPSFVRRTTVESILWFGDRGKNVATVLVPIALITGAFATPALLAAAGVVGDELFHPFDGDRAVEKGRLAKQGYKDTFFNRMRLSWNPNVALWPFGKSRVG